MTQMLVSVDIHSHFRSWCTWTKTRHVFGSSGILKRRHIASGRTIMPILGDTREPRPLIELAIKLRESSPSKGLPSTPALHPNISSTAIRTIMSFFPTRPTPLLHRPNPPLQEEPEPPTYPTPLLHRPTTPLREESRPPPHRLWRNPYDTQSERERSKTSFRGYSRKPT